MVFLELGKRNDSLQVKSDGYRGLAKVDNTPRLPLKILDTQCQQLTPNKS